GADIFYLDGA
nr:Chain P, Analogue of RT-RH pol protease substrate peptide [synthetic construct]